MKIEFVEKNYKISDKLKKIVEEKLEKLDRYFGDDAKARVVCKQENKTQKMEITISNKGLLYRSEVIGENMYENIDLALPKIERQIIRQGSKKRDMFRSKAFDIPGFLFLEEEPEALPDIYKRKTYDLEPITIDDAKEYLERLDNDFYIFLNAESGKVNVMYRRRDGKLGLIEVNY